MGNKSPDLGSMGYACSDCHAALDERSGAFWKDDPYYYMLRALQRTIKVMQDDGLIGIK